MPNRWQMNFVLLQVERVDDSIVADACTETVRSFQPVMWIRSEARTDFIDFLFNARTKR